MISTGHHQLFLVYSYFFQSFPKTIYMSAVYMPVCFYCVLLWGVFSLWSSEWLSLIPTLLRLYVSPHLEYLSMSLLPESSWTFLSITLSTVFIEFTLFRDVDPAPEIHSTAFSYPFNFLATSSMASPHSAHFLSFLMSVTLLCCSTQFSTYLYSVM